MSAVIQQVIPVLMGPTGSGKTALVTNLSPDIFEVISIDSRQVYKELEISSAAPSIKEQSLIPHHLVSILTPNESIDASIFVKRTLGIIAEIINRKKIPILVGGAGFYFKALHTGGLTNHKTPTIIRQKIQAMPVTERLTLLRSLMPEKLVSPNEQASGGRIHPNDDYRIGRALEIELSRTQLEQTVNEITSNQSQNKQNKYTFKGWYLNPDKEEYWNKLNLRVATMLEAGMVEEVSSAYQKYGECQGLQSLGCLNIIQNNSTTLDKEKLQEELFILHRQYGKRQRTWFRQEELLEGILPEQFKSKLDQLLKQHY